MRVRFSNTNSVKYKCEMFTHKLNDTSLKTKNGVKCPFKKQSKAPTWASWWIKTHFCSWRPSCDPRRNKLAFSRNNPWSTHGFTHCFRTLLVERTRTRITPLYYAYFFPLTLLSHRRPSKKRKYDLAALLGPLTSGTVNIFLDMYSIPHILPLFPAGRCKF